MLNPKELIKMQMEAKKMQNRLREKKLSGESKDGMLKIYLNGAQEFEDIWVDDTLMDVDMMDRFKKDMKEAFKDYQKKLQKEMAQDFDLDKIKGMLG
ncbi:MAG: YbaB/EbfC family nucleoid-associated protein [Candidatus Dojkabacteria bacterium]|jgi:DNA-binding protein YbaB|uniref:YbaB/EbfC family nucleoid-associated protein n=1 Tax=Candidatus Dojkabacteria bacterium TaxID=2099670 RepID=A0A847ETS8_9BACT|nr:YbaB/EbfC family nucleoid-associated protein [Candidatus Dojkabacteria bacterium]NLE31145.1 YbaB/EbfC family nucleoid-associated protein [Candidatus Dojkabacteria bacterium]HRX44170.1 YbaB/EbfC family nucleoid-associated protein [Candidatus Dojkabacteria bacterium]